MDCYRLIYFDFFSSCFSWAVTGNPSFPTSQKNRCPGISRTKAKSQTFWKVSFHTILSLRISNALCTLNYSRAKTREQYYFSDIFRIIASMITIAYRNYVWLQLVHIFFLWKCSAISIVWE